MAIDFELPSDADEMLLVGAIFSEATTGGNASDDEKKAIGSCVVNMAFYAAMKSQGGKKCYNDSFGDGTILSAIKKAIKGYNTPRWKLVMDGDKLKSKADLDKLNAGEIKILKAVVTAAGDVRKATPPVAGPGSTRFPLQFNQATDDPPSNREEKLFKLASHTFYGFKDGRECQ